MGSSSPNWDYECPKYVKFNESFDKENDGDSYFEIDHEAGHEARQLHTPLRVINGNQSFEFKSDVSTESRSFRGKSLGGKPQSSKKTPGSCRVYELRPTPSRISRLSHLIQTDTESYVRSSMMTATPYVLRPRSSHPATSGKKHGSSICVQDLRILPTKLEDKPGYNEVSEEKLHATPSLCELKHETEPLNLTPVPEANKMVKILKRKLSLSESDCDVQPSISKKQDVKHVRFHVESDSLFTTPPNNSKFRSMVKKNLTPPVLSSLKGKNVTGSLVKIKTAENSASKQSISINRFRAPLHSSSVKKKVPGSLNTKKIGDESFFPVRTNSSVARKLQMPLPSKKMDRNAGPAGDAKVKSTRPKLTVVKEFQFQTDKRPRRNETKPSTKEVDFVGSLRQHAPPKSNTLPHITIPKPFNLSAPSKRKHEESVDNQVQTLAEKVETFLHKTPERFRSKAPGTGFQPQETYVAQLVHPKSPNLRAVKRHRPITVISHKEEEEIEVRKMKEYKFQAQPFDKRLLHTPHLAKPEVKPPTKPLDIQLQTEKRNLTRHKEEKENEPYVFHAQEIPRNILKGPVGINKKPPIKPTSPVSPAFALKKRSEEWRNSHSSISSEMNQTFQFKANPPPPNHSPFVVKHEKKFTVAKPFSFDDFDKERFAMKEKKIQEEIENDRKKAEFYARPLPTSTFAPQELSVCSTVKKITKPVPFNLCLDKLAEKKEAKKHKQTEEQEERVMRFKAQPASVVKKRPFVPKIRPRPVTAPVEPCLSTMKRAVERSKLKTLRMSIEAEKELEARRQEEEQKQKELEEIKRIRQEIVHKANPVRVYKNVEIKHSEKKLTEPQSPKFATDMRLKKRMEAHE